MECTVNDLEFENDQIFIISFFVLIMFLALLVLLGLLILD